MQMLVDLILDPHPHGPCVFPSAMGILILRSCNLITSRNSNLSLPRSRCALPKLTHPKTYNLNIFALDRRFSFKLIEVNAMH